MSRADVSTTITEKPAVVVAKNLAGRPWIENGPGAAAFRRSQAVAWRFSAGLSRLARAMSRPASRGLASIASCTMDLLSVIVAQEIENRKQINPLVWPIMDDVIRKLTAEQAFEVVLRLHRKGGEIREAAVTEATSVLTEIDLDEISDEVLFALDAIDVEDCWNRSGRSRYDDTSSSLRSQKRTTANCC